MTTPPHPVPQAGRTGRLGALVRRTRPAYLVQEAIGAVPPLATLGLAGYFQTQIAHDVLHFTYPWAAVPALAIEGAAAYCAVLYDRHLVAGDSTIALRIGMLGYAFGSSALLAWHANATGKPWQVSLAVGLLTLSAMFLWTRRGKWRKRLMLRERGLIDTQVVRFSAARYLAAPLETPAALRYAVKHSITDPQEALSAWRTHRDAAKTAKAATAKVRTPAKTQPEPDETSTPGVRESRTPTRTPTSRTPRKTGTGKLRAINDDAAALENLRKAYPTRVPTLAEIEKTDGCKRPRAVRLRRLLTQSVPVADADPERVEVTA